VIAANTSVTIGFTGTFTSSNANPDGLHRQRHGLPLTHPS